MIEEVLRARFAPRGSLRGPYRAGIPNGWIGVEQAGSCPAASVKCRRDRVRSVCFVFGLSGWLLACEAPWYVRPEAPGRLEYLSGHRGNYRVCLRAGKKPITALELEAAGTLRGELEPKAGACGRFQGEAAVRALDRESTIVVKSEGASTAERIPLTSATTKLVPYSRFEAEGRLGYVQPLADGYGGLLQLHNTISYRLSPVRIGGIFEARFGSGTGLLGTGVVTNVGVALADRWLLGLEGGYLLGIAAWGKANWDGQWYHGPTATLSLGHTPATFLGAPPTVERALFGPALSAEYLWVPRNEQAVVTLSAAFFVRYGL